ncbi:MAG: SigB/SigF/SigG family RNA polymerase sigma factor [Candidatus Xenobium sp.]|jgi:RNA polymerase sigma-B factor|nr:SigB/SigF/SigG family RNA polymerase sigma factor [Burkholderiales bacterium]
MDLWRDRDRVRELLKDYARTRDPQTKAELAALHLNLVRYLAGKFAGRGESLEDLVQVGSLGLVKALDRYDPERGNEFTTYATPTIVGEIKRHFRDKGWAMKIPRRLQELNQSVNRTSEQMASELGRAPTVQEIAERLEVAADEVLQAQELGRAYNMVSLNSEIDGENEGKSASLLDYLGQEDLNLERVEDRLALRRAFASLPPREQHLMFLRYFENRSQSDIARILDISQMHVSRLQQRSLERMKQALVEIDPGRGQSP